MDKLNKKQKKFITLSCVLIIAFFIFVALSFYYVNGNNNKANNILVQNDENYDSSDNYNNSSDSPLEISNREPDNDSDGKEDLDTTSESSNNNTDLNSQNNENLNNNSASNESNNNTNNSTKSNNSSNKPSESITEITNSSSSQYQGSNTTSSEANVTAPQHKAYIINIKIANSDTVFFSGTIESDTQLTAYDALKMYADQNDIEIKKQGSDSLAYITSIDNLKERDYGPSSGWLYKVNDSFPSIPCGKYTLESEDTLEWIYTKDGGKDVNSK